MMQEAGSVYSCCPGHGCMHTTKNTLCQVILLFKDVPLSLRRSFEDKIVKQLKETGIDAVSSAAAISSDKKLDKEVIVS